MVRMKMEMDHMQLNDAAAAGGGGGGGGRSRSIFAKPQRAVTLKFLDVEYKIKTKENGSGSGGREKAKETERKILKGVSGAVIPGEMLAMMGPSGCGKTTLLTALGGRLQDGNRRGRLAGDITYNGRPFSNSLKRSTGFVTQDDALYPHLTVRETLVYTALLRLPSALSRREKSEQAEAIMAQLGLTGCSNSIVGGPFVRGVSGGERKRVSIGQELLIDPSLLLLDEPTSGLDSTTAARIVSIIRDVAVGGSRTVVMTIHQPSSRLFYMFHKLLLLSDGHPIYFGKASDAMDHFAGIGFAPAVAMNPADFLLDLANGVSSNEISDDRVHVKEALVSAYNLHLRDQVVQEVQDLSKRFKQDGAPYPKTTQQWCTGWWQQFSILLERGLKERKHESFSGLKIAQVLVSALLAGLLWFHSQGHVQDQIGLLFYIDGYWSFFPLVKAIFTFPQERVMLTKERSSGMYRLSAYFFARMVGDLPMELILPIVFINITYWMCGLNPEAASFFAYTSITLLNVLVSQGLGLAIGAFVVDLKNATTLSSVLMQTLLIAAGYYVQHVPPFISWIKYASMSFYAFKLQIATQYSPDDTYECAPNRTCHVADLPIIKVTGFDHRAEALLAMFVLLVLYRFVAYLGLMRVGIGR